MGAGASADQSKAAEALKHAGHDESEPVSVVELKELLGSQWSEERIKKLIAVFDDDGDGRLNDSEWKRACALLGELPERVGGLLKEKTRAAAEKAEAASKAKAETEKVAAEAAAAEKAEKAEEAAKAAKAAKAGKAEKAPPIEFPAGTPADTQEAIRTEIARVRQLPPAELAKLGTKYTDPEALWEALGALNGKATHILRAKWVKTQRGGRLPKRGDKLPPEALITVKELREIHSKSKAEKALPAITLSHYWRTKEHPDPDGVTLELVIDALEAHWADFEERGVTDLGILIDWCGLYQAPRTEEQTPIFAEALKAINQWYAHQGTTVWCVTGGVDSAVGLGYHDKGWPSFEYRLAMMIKVSNDSAASDWPQVLDLGKQGDAQWQNLARAAPAEPLAFFGGHEYGEKKYTNGADRDKIVAPKFRETTFELLGGVTELNFNRLNWGDDEAVQLAVVLPLCAKLTELTLVGNQVGDRGAAALAGAIKGNGALTTLYLQNNQIGDAGAAALADALRVNGALKELYLARNQIGDAGAAALADALRANGALRTLYVNSNQIGDAGAAALADALRVNGALKELRLDYNQIGADSKSKLATNVMRF